MKFNVFRLKIISILLITFASFIFPSNTSAYKKPKYYENPWYHVTPLQSGPVTIQIDFQNRFSCYYGDHIQIATPVWINVRRDNLGPDDVVQVMLINYNQKDDETYLLNEFSFNGPLQYNESGHFSAMSHPILLYHYPRNESFRIRSIRQEIIVWINGEIYKDPLSGNNITFNLWDYMPGYRGY